MMMTGSVTGAAARLFVTQPAISHLLRDAETILGFALFDRRFGRLVPTPKADLLFEEIERSFLGIDSINDFCGRLRDSGRRTITVAAVPVISVALLPLLIRSYREAIGPDFFVVHSRPTDVIVSWVGSQKVDLGLALDTIAIPGVASEVIGQFPALCLLPHDHRLAAHAVVTPADLRTERMITLSRSEGVAALVGRAFPPDAPLPEATVECAMATAVCAMVEAGIGFAILDPVSAFPFRSARIVIRPFVPETLFTFRAYWLTARKPSFDRARVVQIARQHLAAIGVHFAIAAGPLRPRRTAAERVPDRPIGKQNQGRHRNEETAHGRDRRFDIEE